MCPSFPLGLRPIFHSFVIDKKETSLYPPHIVLHFPIPLICVSLQINRPRLIGVDVKWCSFHTDFSFICTAKAWKKYTVALICHIKKMNKKKKHPQCVKAIRIDGETEILMWMKIQL